MAGTLLVTACQPTGKTGDVIGKQPVKVENGIMTTEVLMAFGRVSGPVVSPDKSKILYGVSYENLEQNKSNRELFVMDIDGQNKKQITCTPESDRRRQTNSIPVGKERRFTIMDYECRR